MLATDRFLFLSIGRTGTGAVHEWLRRVPGLRIISELPHERRDVMVAKCRAVGVKVPPAWTIIRNLWDYYVDKWAWERDRGPCFQGTLKELLERTRAQSTVDGPFYSLTQIWDIIGGNHCEYVARFEAYDEDITAILLRLIPDLLTKGEITRQIASNRGNGASYLLDGRIQWLSDYRDWYDDEIRRWVLELDGELIDRFEYSF